MLACIKKVSKVIFGYAMLIFLVHSGQSFGHFIRGVSMKMP